MIKTKKLTKIEDEFIGGLNPYSISIQASTIEWAKELKLLSGNNLNKYQRQNISYLASRAQPYDSFQDVMLTSDYLLLFCMLDDYSDNVQDSIEFEKYSNDIIAILNEDTTYTEDVFLSGWEDWWGRVKIGTPLEWQNRIIKSIAECFKAISWEIKNQKRNKIPIVEHYINNRQHSGSVFVCFDLIERGGKTFLPKEVRSDLLVELINSANNIANWTNDILSLEKEIEDDEIHNLVICVQKQSRTTLEDSLEYVKKMLDLEISKYNELKEKLFIEQPCNSDIKKYISRMENGVRGHYEWSIRTKRF